MLKLMTPLAAANQRVLIVLVAAGALGVVLWQDHLQRAEVSLNFAQQAGRDVRREWLMATKPGDWLFVEDSANGAVIRLHEVVQVGAQTVELRRYDKPFRMQDIQKPAQLQTIDLSGVPSRPVQADKNALLLRGVMTSPALARTHPGLGDWVVQMRRN